MDSGQDNQVTYSTRQTLIMRVRNQQDEQAWAEFVDIYTRFIYAIIRSMKMSTDDVKEIHQSVIIKLWKKMPEIDLTRTPCFRAYVTVMVKNEVRQFIRARKRLLARENNAANDASLTYLNNIRTPDIKRIAEAEWHIHITNIALHKIEPYFSPNAIELFRLSMKGASPDEITEKTGIARNSIKTIKSRVKSRLCAEINQLKIALQ